MTVRKLNYNYNYNSDLHLSSNNNSTLNQEKAVVEAWIIGIAKNIVNDYLRKKQKSFKFISIDNIFNIFSTEKDPENIVLLNEEYKNIMEHISKLNPKERHVLSLKFGTD